MDWKDFETTELGKIFKEITCLDQGGDCAQILRAAIQSSESAEYIKCQKKIQELQDQQEKLATSFCANYQAGHKHMNESFITSCFNFVNYQKSEVCNNDKQIFEEEGFQIGSPWHGDVINAPILFLSSNPGVTYRCLYPRWHQETDTFTLGGTSELNNSTAYTDENGKLLPIAKIDKNDPGRCIWDFFAGRLPMTLVDGKNLNAWVIQGDNKTCKGKIVPFWVKMRDFMDQLLKNPEGIPEPEHTRCLMNSVLSAEIIPFGSQKETGVTEDVLDYWWDNFVCKLLANCGAKILVLVGGKARETFLRALKRNFGKKAQLKSGTLFDDDAICPYLKEYRIAAIAHFSDFSQSRSYRAVVKALQDEANGDPNGTVAKALKKARELYGPRSIRWPRLF